jgi:hypothetical protein
MLGQADLWVAHGVGLAALAVGVVLWLMGRPLARPACAGLWVILGIMVAGAICRLTGDSNLLPLWLAAGGLIGGAIGWVLYRICLAIALGLLLLLAAPAGVYLVQHGLGGATQAIQQVAAESSSTSDKTATDGRDAASQITEQVHQKTEQATAAMKKTIDDAQEKAKSALDSALRQTRQAVSQGAQQLLAKMGESTQPAGDDKTKSTKSDAPATKHKSVKADEATQDESIASHALQAPDVNSWLHTIRSLAQGPWDKLSNWWATLADGERHTMLLASVIGAICGLILGLIFPKLGAQAGSSLLGTLCMAAGAAIILGYDHPQTLDQLSNQSPLCLTALGLITLLGVVIQWTLQRRRTDN